MQQTAPQTIATKIIHVGGRCPPCFDLPRYTRPMDRLWTPGVIATSPAQTLSPALASPPR